MFIRLTHCLLLDPEPENGLSGELWLSVCVYICGITSAILSSEETEQKKQLTNSDQVHVLKLVL